MEKQTFHYTQRAIQIRRGDLKQNAGEDIRVVPEGLKKLRQAEIQEQWRAGRENGFVSTTKTMGKGLFAQAALKKGTLIGEYLGKEATGPIVEKYFNKPPSVYCFFWIEDGDMIMRDAKKTRNNVRYMNHAIKNSNCRIELVELDGRMRPLMCTRRAINMGEQLFWDYGERDKEILKNHKFLSK